MYHFMKLLQLLYYLFLSFLRRIVGYEYFSTFKTFWFNLVSGSSNIRTFIRESWCTELFFCVFGKDEYFTNADGSFEELHSVKKVSGIVDLNRSGTS
uniref:Putative secreted protein n=1 Tax=Anopheles triannulatus TaxID=58253 RepID=A0A2M4B3Z6_9DIPT